MTTSITQAIKTRNYAHCDIEAVVERLERKLDFDEAEFAVFIKREYLLDCLEDELSDPFGGNASHFKERIEWCDSKLSEYKSVLVA